MLPNFIHTLTIASKVLICHYHPVPNEKAYVVQILNHVLYNTKFSMQCNDQGIWSITSPVSEEILQAQPRFADAIEARLRERQATA